MSNLKYIEREELCNTLTELQMYNMELESLLLKYFKSDDIIIVGVQEQFKILNNLVPILAYYISEDKYKEIKKLVLSNLLKAKIATDIMLPILMAKQLNIILLTKAKEYYGMLEGIVNSLMLDFRGDV